VIGTAGFTLEGGEKRRERKKGKEGKGGGEGEKTRGGGTGRVITNGTDQPPVALSATPPVECMWA